MAMFCFASLAYAQEEKAVPHSGAEVKFSFAPVVKKAAPAVVNIYTNQRVTVMENNSPFANNPFFQQFLAQQGLSFGGRPRELVTNSLGSGVIVNPKGYIVTAQHVIKDAQKITVVLSNKEEYEAKVMMNDPKSDLAFLKIEPSGDLPFLEMRDSDTVEVGDLVLAIGNPFGVGQTVTNGIISALARKAEGVSDYQYFIQTDAAINPGNSGGALVTTDGKLVGINTAIYSKSGGSMGIGFAIPSNMVRSLLASKVEGGRIVHPWLGASGQMVTREIAESVGLKAAQGVILRLVYDGSPAQKAGLKVGDIVTAIGGTAISTPQDMAYRLVLAKIGEATKFTRLRDGKEEAIEVTLVAPPENPKRDLKLIKGRNPLSGVTVGNLSPALAAEMGLNDTASGVVVVTAPNVAGGITLWAKGDVILEINGTKITSGEQLAQLVGAEGHEWKIAYQRGANINVLNIKM